MGISLSTTRSVHSVSAKSSSSIFHPYYLTVKLVHTLLIANYHESIKRSYCRHFVGIIGLCLSAEAYYLTTLVYHGAWGFQRLRVGQYEKNWGSGPGSIYFPQFSAERCPRNRLPSTSDRPKRSKPMHSEE